MNRLEAAVTNKLNQMYKSSLISFARHGKNGGKFYTKEWANGKTMVHLDGVDWATSAHAVERSIAVRIFKNNWVIPQDLL